MAWIDWAKAIGITLVIWGLISSCAHDMIYMFHMPFFFLISGFLFKQKGMREEIKSSFFSLIVPYLIYNFIYLLPLPLGGGYQRGYVINILLGNQETLSFLFRPLWFIVALFSMRILCSVPKISMAVKGLSTLIVSILLFSVLKINQDNDCFQIKTALLCTPIFVLGYFLKDKRLFDWLGGKNKYGMVALCVLIFIMGLLVGNHNAPKDGINVFRCETGNSIALFYLSASLMSMSLLGALRCLLCNVRLELVETISKGTLLVLATHLIVFWKIPRVFSNDLTSALFNLIAILIASYIMIKMAERFCPVLLGKSRKTSGYRDASLSHK